LCKSFPHAPGFPESKGAVQSPPLQAVPFSLGVPVSFLSDALASTRATVAARIAQMPLEQVRRDAAAQPPALDFRGALSGPEVALIAEIKRASPSAGPIAPGLDAGAQAEAYYRGGAAAVSVLTEGPHFAGSVEDLLAARRACPLPLLRKDFIIDPYQVWEARAARADAVLLIVAALDQSRLVEMMDVVELAGMAALVETHEEEEVRRAVMAGARVIGVNARDLSSLSVDMGRMARLRQLIPAGRVVVAESGVRSREDVQALESVGVDAVLVGESLVRAADPAAKVAELLGREVA